MEWIACSEMVPNPERKSYLVYLESGHVCECRWTNANMFLPDQTTEWHWNIFDIPQYDNVLAWMPLPTPYKENVEQTKLFLEDNDD